MIMKNILTYILALLAINVVHAQVPEPAKPQEGPIAIINANIHTGTGDVISNGALAFDDGKLTYVGSAQSFDGHQIIDADDKHVYPGLILPTTQLGLVDINAVRPTRDYQEVGDYKPHVRSLIAYNTDSELIATLRYNGILLAQTTPAGGRIPGTSSVMMLEGWNWEDAAYQSDDALHVNWPQLSFRPRWWLGETSRRPNKNYDKQVAELKTFFSDAKSYSKANNSESNLLLEAIAPVFDGSKRLFVRANHSKTIIDAIQYFSSIGVANTVLVGGQDAWRVKELLKEKNIPVLLGDVHERPSRDDEDIDLAYKMPAMLSEEGIKVGLTYGNLQSSRNLPFFAGTAVAYGMEKEEALKLMTANTAEILGVGDRAGSLEVGKDAILFISEGDVMDMRTSKLTHAFIMGKELNLDGKQQALYDRFKRKYSND